MPDGEPSTDADAPPIDSFMVPIEDGGEAHGQPDNLPADKTTPAVVEAAGEVVSQRPRSDDYRAGYQAGYMAGRRHD